MDKKELLIQIQDKDQLNIIHVLRINYSYASFKFKEGNIIFWSSENEQSKPSKTVLNNLLKDLQNDWDKYQYARDRKVEYPGLDEQLDMIYHNIDDWKAKILAIKSKYPKGV
tara:strand:+ start:30 stop:365 length:336 start_codon:yes stop_codon:yes gene_type:complete